MKKVTRLFINGSLKGLTHTELTSVPFKKGKIYRAIGGSDYRIIEIKKVK